LPVEEWAELLQELRLLRVVLEQQNELLVVLIEGQREIKHEVMRAGLS
jgi:hypothetical protein